MGKAGTRVPSVWYTKRTPLLKSGRSSTHIRVSNLRCSTAVDHHGKTIDVDTKTTMDEYPYGELFLKKSMAPVRTKVHCSHAKPQLTLKSPKNATKTTKTTRTTRAARTTRTTTHRGERRAFLGWQYAKAEVSNFQTNTGLMRYMTSTTMYRCTTWMRQQGTRVLQEKSFIRDTFSSCNNGTAGGRDRQLDRQIGVTSRIVEYDHCC